MMGALCESRGQALVSVVMPSFNSEATLAAAIESVRAQSLTDWVLIVVDDGSRDRSVEIARTFAERDARVISLQQSNAGPSRARNRGVQVTNSAFVAFLDSDDVWEPNHLAEHVAALEARPELGVSFAPSRIITEDGEFTGEQTRAWDRDVSLGDLLSCNPTATCSAIVVRREIFATAGAMREDMVHAEDQEWLFRIGVHGWAIRGRRQPTLRYRTSAQGLSADTAKMLAGWSIFLNHARNLRPEIVSAYAAEARARMELYYARRVIRTGGAGRRARSHLRNAIGANLGIVLRRPLFVAGIAAASFAPESANAAIAAIAAIRRLKQ